MSKILKKFAASLMLIMMLFSVCFNVLDYGYKVYAMTNNGIGNFVFKSNVEGMGYYDPTVFGTAVLTYETKNLKSIETATSSVDDCISYTNTNSLNGKSNITIYYDEKSVYKLEKANASTIDFQFIGVDVDGNIVRAEYSIPIRYEFPECKVNITGDTIKVNEDGKYSGTISFNWVNDNADFYDLKVEFDEYAGKVYSATNNIMDSITIDSGGWTVPDLRALRGNTNIDITFKWTGKTANAKSGSYTYTKTLVDTTTNSKIEKVEWKDGKFKLDEENESVELDVTISNYKNGTDPVLKVDGTDIKNKFDVSETSKTNGTSKTYKYTIKLKSSIKEYNSPEEILVSYEGESEKIYIYIDKKENTGIRTSIAFQQTGKSPNTFDCKTAKDGEEVIITVTLSGLSGISEETVKKALLQIDKCPGFTKVSKSGPTFDPSGNAIFAWKMKYDESIGISESEIECVVKGAIGGKTLTAKQIIKIENAKEEETGPVAYYYGTGNTAPKEFKNNDSITIKNTHLNIYVYNKDTTAKQITFEEASSTINGKPQGANTVYSIIFSESATYTLKLAGEFTLKVTIDLSNDDDATYAPASFGQWLYVFDKDNYGSGTITYTGSYNTAKVDRHEPDQTGTMGGTPNWIITDNNNNKIKYYCFNHDKELKFHEGGNFYYIYQRKSQKLDNVKAQLILAFLKEVSNEEASKIAKVTLSGDDWREHAIQYYIWQNLQIGSKKPDYGTAIGNIIAALEAPSNKYINEKNSTITIDGKTIKIKNFIVIRYDVAYKIYADGPYAGMYKERFNIDIEIDLQPLITFDYDTEEGNLPPVKLLKVDKDTKEPLSAKFQLYKLDRNSTTPLQPLGSEIQTTKGDAIGIALDKISLAVDGEYVLVETEAPEGYNIAKEYVVLEVKDGEISIKEIFLAANYTSTGVADVVKDFDKASKKFTGTPVKPEDSLWEDNVTIETNSDGSSYTVYTIILNNDKDKPRLKKVDATTNKPLPNAVFQLYWETMDLTTKEKILQKIEGKTITTGSDGYADLGEFFNDSTCYTDLGDGKKQIILQEETAPEGYNKSDAVYVITMDNDGKLTVECYASVEDWKNGKQVENSNNYVAIEDGGLTIVIKNKIGTPTVELIKLGEKGPIIITDEDVKAGATRGKFRIEIQAGSETIYSESELTLDKDGKIKIELKPEQIAKITADDVIVTVILQEIEAPKTASAMYALDDTEYTFKARYVANVGWEIINDVSYANARISSNGGTLQLILTNHEDNPRIEINKVDTSKKTISGTAIFKVYAEDGTLLDTITVTDGVSTTFKIPNVEPGKTYKFYIQEIISPDGYELDGGKKLLEIEIDENGKVTKATFNGKPVTLNEGNLIRFDFVNKPITPSGLKLKIQKIDGNTNALITADTITFDITGDIKAPGSYNTSGGIIGPLDYVDIILGKHYTVTLVETGATGVYNATLDSTPITVTIHINEDGTMDAPELGAGSKTGVIISTETDSDGSTIIVLTIKNYGETKKMAVPLLMYVEGTVWLDGLDGKDSSSNGELGNEEDKNLDGILVELYEEGGSTPAKIAKSDDVQKILDDLVKYQHDMDAATAASELGFTITPGGTGKPAAVQAAIASKLVDAVRALYADLLDTNRFNMSDPKVFGNKMAVRFTSRRLYKNFTGIL